MENDKSPEFNEIHLSESSFEDVSMGSECDESPAQPPHCSVSTKSKLESMFGQIKKSIGTFIKQPSNIASQIGGNPQTPTENYQAIQLEEARNHTKKSTEESDDHEMRLVLTEESKTEKGEEQWRILKKDNSRMKERLFTMMTHQRVAKEVQMQPNSRWKRVKQFYNGIKFRHM